MLQLRLAPGRKGLRKALGDVPSWVAFQDREKVEVGSHSHHLHRPFPDLGHIPVGLRDLPAGQDSSVVIDESLGLAPSREW